MVSFCTQSFRNDNHIVNQQLPKLDLRTNQRFSTGDSNVPVEENSGVRISVKRGIVLFSQEAFQGQGFRCLSILFVGGRPDPIYGSKENTAVSSLLRQTGARRVVAETIGKRGNRGMMLKEQADMITAEAAIAVEEKREHKSGIHPHIDRGAKEIKAA